LGLCRVSAIMFFASFQSAGKWPRRRCWLNKCVECARGVIGRCRRHKFGMPSKLQGRKLTGMSSSTVASRSLTRASTCSLWSCALNWFSKQSSIMLALSIG
jgi:hypothetical protein